MEKEITKDEFLTYAYALLRELYPDVRKE